MRSCYKKELYTWSEGEYYPSDHTKPFWIGKVTIRTKTDGIYRYTATGVKCMKNVISYFKVLPLLTKKAQSFEK